MSANHGNWVKSNEYSTLSEGKLIAPGNLRATQDNKGYNDLFNFWIQNSYQLRYTGGFVADVNQLMVKGKGVFVNVASQNTKSKLRMLYEVVPLAYLIEKAGGKSSAGDGSVLNIIITDMEQTTQVAFGSRNEVERFEELVGKTKPYSNPDRGHKHNSKCILP
jgi:sedoheptulose-bisphosphatase